MTPQGGRRIPSGIPHPHVHHAGANVTRTHGKRADIVVHGHEPFNAESLPAALAHEPLTPVDVFYVRNHGPVPKLDPADWRLAVGGLVAHPLRLSLDQLRDDFAVRRIVATLQCAGNRRASLHEVRAIPGETLWGPGATGTAEWEGVRLSDVLKAAGIVDHAHHVEFVGADTSPEASPPQPFGASISRHKALAGEVLLAWAMNGRPLPPVHGAPLRVVVPGYIGARSVKWLERIVARTEPSENFFQSRSYRLLPPDQPAEAALDGAGLALGAVAVNCDILVPHDGARVAPGRLQLDGYAFAGDDRHIVRVDVSDDGGETWRQAELLDAASRWAWRRWRIRMDVAAGETEIVARAWDSAAATQPADPAQVWNAKGYANNAWARLRVTVTD